MFLLLLLIVVTLGFFLFFFISFFFNDKTLDNPPYSPPSYPIIGSLIPFFKNRRRLLHWYTDLLSASPTATVTIRRLGARRTILTANPANVEHILKTNFPNYPKGKPFTELLGDLLGCGIFNSDGVAWSSQRKLASHEFTARTLRGLVFESLQEVVQKRLVPLLGHVAERGSVVDFQDVLKRFAFDVVCKISLGSDPFCLDLNGPLPELVKAFDIAAEISAGRAAETVNAIWKMKRLLNVGTERKLREAIRTVQVCVSEIIRSKKRNLEKENKDLLSRFLLAGHDDETVRDMVISFIMAGRDTTSAAMTWLFWLLTQNSDVKAEILKEVDFLVEKAKDSKLGLIGFEDLKEMNYTKACLCESMRLYPPVAWDSKHALDDDVMPDGTSVRRGDRVTYTPYGMGRMKRIWGKDWAEFRPDRWFGGTEPEGWNGRVLRAVSPYEFPVFQAGPRVCLGKEMALVQMKYVVGSVLRRFEIKPVCLNPPVFVPRLTAHMADGFKVRIKRREGIEN